MKIYLKPLGHAADLSYTHAEDGKQYVHRFGAKTPAYHADIAGKTFVMIEVPRMVTRAGKTFIGEKKKK